MRFRTIVVALLLAGGIVPAQALAQVAAPEAELLHQVSETYRGLGSYLLEGSISIMAKGANAPTTQEIPFLIAAAPGGKSRDEVRSGQLGGMILSDGRQTTIYNAPLGQYMRKPGRADSATAGTSSRGLRAAVIARFADIAKSATAAKRLPDATLTLSGVPRDCAVIEVTYPPLMNSGLATVDIRSLTVHDAEGKTHPMTLPTGAKSWHGEVTDHSPITV